jgi:mono/diheme cytochrome c family protein
MKNHGFLIAATALVGLGGLLLEARGQTSGGSRSPAANASASAKATDSTPPVAPAAGKKIFVERCANCHGEDGTKPVGGGLPLSERKLTDELLWKNVRGRLKGYSETEQRAVAAYIRSFQNK